MSSKRIRASDSNEGLPELNLTHEYAFANCFSDLNNRSQYKFSVYSRHEQTLSYFTNVIV